MAYHGGCDCGSVRYVLSGDRFPKIICCHCHECQTRSGSAFDQTAFVDKQEFQVTGQLVTSTRQMPSGRVSTLSACGTCYGTVFIVNSSRPDTILLRAGTLDESESIVPIAHLFTSEKQTWVTLPDNVPAFERLPSPSEYFKLFD